MFVFYSKEVVDENSFILKQNIINTTDFTFDVQENGDILCKAKYIPENLTQCIDENIININVDDVVKYDFKSSKILQWKINDITYNDNLKYKAIYKKIYEIIGDGAKVIKNSCLNITIGKKEDKGFVFLPSLNISIQGACAEKVLQEIITQSSCNNIRLEIKTQLADKTAVCITV
jgi:hypothetical protein